MPVLSFFIQLSGATLLLLFAVRMVRTGIERAFGARFQRAMTAERSLLAFVPVGLGMAMIMQSSAAVAVLVAGFSGSGTVAFAPGLAMVLGGDLGSALLILILSQPLDWLLPILLSVGAFLFLKFEGRRLRQAGRIILGVAFILIALQFLRAAVEPVRESDILPALSAYLTRDYVSAFLAGAALAALMHSSVAVILMCVAIVALNALPLEVGVSIVLGANLGSALIPVWLTRTMPPPARRVVFANLALRGSMAVLALFVTQYSPVLTLLPDIAPGTALILVHIVFNAAVLLTLALAPVLEPLGERLLPGRATPIMAGANHQSHLDPEALNSNVRALACLRREVIRMADVLGTMLSPLMTLYHTFDAEKRHAILTEEAVLNTALDEIRLYSAALGKNGLEKPAQKEMRALVDYAIALEAAGDIVVKRLIPLTQEKAEQRLRFSKAGRAELERIHEKATRNLATAASVLVSDDIEGARLLLEEKAEMSRLERKSRKQHLKRLTAGDADSFGSSDIHLETAYSLKELNSWIVTVAHPILVREGQLLETRLIKDIPAGDG